LLLDTWVISKVLHSVGFLFKNEFVLQNTFTGLQFNLHCVLSQRSNVWASPVFLSGRLRCWCFDYSDHLFRHLLNASEAFSRSGFCSFGNTLMAGGLMSGLYGEWGSTCHPYFSKISDTAPEAWGRPLMYDRWSLHEIWLQSVSSSFARLHFAEQAPRSLPIRTHFSLPKPGSQLSRKSEILRHPTGRASAVCRTFEMTYVSQTYLLSFKNTCEV